MAAVTMDTNTIFNDCDAADGGTGRDDVGSSGYSGGNTPDTPVAPIPRPAAGFLLLGALGGFGLLRASRKTA